MIFQYPQEAHTRRHGPAGYLNYQSYKPWLRSEFNFRCVYCLWRERWCPSGDAAFGVEHLKTQVAAPELIGVYENLIYACCRCNSIRSDAEMILDPCRDIFADHLKVQADGSILGLSSKGEHLIEICRLDHDDLNQARSNMLELVAICKSDGSKRALDLLNQHLSDPDNVPNLKSLRPPGGNSRPEGIA